MTTFDCLDFSADNLFDALRAPEQARQQVAAGAQAQYLVRYLTAVRARTIIVEHEYIDGDYLDDYAAFYAKSFAKYPRWCKRLHFFRDDITEVAFRGAVQSAACPDGGP
jgi:hypothetical protein